MHQKIGIPLAAGRKPRQGLGVVGALLLGFVENFGIWHLSGEWKDAIAFAVLILFLLFRPVGIFKR